MNHEPGFHLNYAAELSDDWGPPLINVEIADLRKDPLNLGNLVSMRSNT